MRIEERFGAGVGARVGARFGSRFGTRSEERLGQQVGSRAKSFLDAVGRRVSRWPVRARKSRMARCRTTPRWGNVRGTQFDAVRRDVLPAAPLSMAAFPAARPGRTQDHMRPPAKRAPTVPDRRPVAGYWTLWATNAAILQTRNDPSGPFQGLNSHPAFPTPFDLAQGIPSIVRPTALHWTHGPV